MSVFWPSLDDSKSAHKACASAAGIAFFIAIVTGIVAWLQASGKINMFPEMGKMAYIDVALFILIGIGLCFNSRIAAVAGLLLYLAERAFMIKATGFQASQVVAILIFGLAFVNGVRGSLAWHEQKKLEKGEPVAEVSIEVAAEHPKRSFPTKTIFLLIVLLVVAGAAYFLMVQKGSLPTIKALKQKTQTLTKSVTPRKPAAPLVAPAGPAIKLRLKSGRSFEGVLTKKNSAGYWVFIDGMGEVFFSVNEVAEAS